MSPIRAVRRLRERGAHPEAGLTLPELLVTLFLLAVIGTLVAQFAVTVSRTVTRESARMDSTNVAAAGMNSLTRVIRAGTAIEWEATGKAGASPMITYAGRERLAMWAAVDTDADRPRPFHVEFRMDAERVLTEHRTTPRKGNAPTEPAWVATGVGTGTRERVIARTIVPRASGEKYLFTYWDEDGNELVPPAGGSLGETDRMQVAAIEVTLKVQADPSERAEPVLLTNKVGISNFKLGAMGVRE